MLARSADIGLTDEGADVKAFLAVIVAFGREDGLPWVGLGRCKLIFGMTALRGASSASVMPLNGSTRTLLCDIFIILPVHDMGIRINTTS
ncbi:MAG: hypothetical protein A2Z15_08870 [Chloroflexi bacterium RBG_16_50_11]|nr:MAG: hypothetical protein A2Z15_08870 [Chloroflexi bacterium RBG_16_50_11]